MPNSLSAQNAAETATHIPQQKRTNPPTQQHNIKSCPAVNGFSTVQGENRQRKKIGSVAAIISVITCSILILGVLVIILIPSQRNNIDGNVNNGTPLSVTPSNEDLANPAPPDNIKSAESSSPTINAQIDKSLYSGCWTTTRGGSWDSAENGLRWMETITLVLNQDGSAAVNYLISDTIISAEYKGTWNISSPSTILLNLIGGITSPEASEEERNRSISDYRTVLSVTLQNQTMVINEIQDNLYLKWMHGDWDSVFVVGDTYEISNTRASNSQNYTNKEVLANTVIIHGT